MTEKKEYKVLARKYRPVDFDGLIGQEVLVKTLTNALESGRIAHAYMLTGIRGVGKTTTARIMARALNYGDKKNLPTANFKELTDSCKMIIEGNHVDVIEMDAASRTGVDDIREIIEGVQYAPVSARYKVYIIDEVHMLSKSAFNALLKTLEEPPSHVKFIFATTEIRKVPITVLSRCQRFDLRRIDQQTLANYFAELVKREKTTIEPEALQLIAKAADGSARDGLSLLDQAIALGDKTISTKQVQEMLGLSDRTKILDLFEMLVAGKAKETLDISQDLYKSGADPLVVIQDLLDVTHLMSKIQTVPELAEESGLPEADRMKGTELATQLSVPILTRIWQVLMKGLTEVSQAPDSQAALEMVLIRLLYTSDMPTPGDLVKMIKTGQVSERAQSETAPLAKQTDNKQVSEPRSFSGSRLTRTKGAFDIQRVEQPKLAQAPQTIKNPQSFEEVVALFGEKGEIKIQTNLISFVRLVHFQPGHIEFNLLSNAMERLVGAVGKLLSEWTNERWIVSVSQQEGLPTIAEQEKAAQEALLYQAETDSAVQKVIELFPGAKVVDVL